MSNNNGVGKNAPALIFVGDKFNNKGTISSSNKNGYHFGQQADIIRNYICQTLTGNNGNYLKLMWLLLSTDEGFKVSQKWVLDSTGMTKDKYYDTRKDLCAMNWLIYDAEKEELGINYDFMWRQACLPKNEREKVLDWRKQAECILLNRRKGGTLNPFRKVKRWHFEVRKQAP